MGYMLEGLWEACADCLTLNGSIYFALYAFLVLLAGISQKNKWSVSSTLRQHSFPDFAKFNIPTMSIQTMILQLVSGWLTSEKYISSLKSFGGKINLLTGIGKRSFVGNLIFFFMLYYVIVSAPAFLMLPVNYTPQYNGESLFALFLMMITNAVGDIISFKITISNVNRIYGLHKDYVLADDVSDNFSRSFKAEALLYIMTIIDMLLAITVLILVLVLTSIYFGVSVGEYSFDLSMITLNGSIERIILFWETAWEPYALREAFANGNDIRLPMLLIYSATSFIPTIIIFSFALFWTLMMPLRIIYLSKMDKYIKIIVSEMVVAVICTFVFFLKAHIEKSIDLQLYFS